VALSPLGGNLGLQQGRGQQALGRGSRRPKRRLKAKAPPNPLLMRPPPQLRGPPQGPASLSPSPTPLLLHTFTPRLVWPLPCWFQYATMPLSKPPAMPMSGSPLRGGPQRATWLLSEALPRPSPSSKTLHMSSPPPFSPCSRSRRLPSLPGQM